MGVQAGLAGLQLDEVEDLGLPGQHQVVEAEQDGGAPAHGDGGPGGLGGAGLLEGGGHVLGGVASGRSASFSPVKGVWLAVRPEPITPRVSLATSSGVTTSAAVRAPAGAGGRPGWWAPVRRGRGRRGACESVMAVSVFRPEAFGYPWVTGFCLFRQ
ncbi:hypothetical protein GCM10020254_36150 [Streptomyces goshikiensis]